VKITKAQLKQIIKEERSKLVEQTVDPERWEKIFAGVISDKWWVAYNAATKGRKTRAAAMARKELEKAIMESGVLRTVTNLIASVEENLNNAGVDR